MATATNPVRAKETIKNKLDRYRSAARRNRPTSWGDQQDADKEDEQLLEAFREARNRANKTK